MLSPSMVGDYVGEGLTVTYRANCKLRVEPLTFCPDFEQIDAYLSNHETKYRPSQEEEQDVFPIGWLGLEERKPRVDVLHPRKCRERQTVA